MSHLTEDQRHRMEENRKKALERLANKNATGIFAKSNQLNSESKSVKPSTFYNPTTSNKAVSQMYDISCSSRNGTVSNPSSTGNSVKCNGSGSFDLGAKNSQPSSFKTNDVKIKPAVFAAKNNGQFIQGSFVLLSRKRFLADVGYHREMIEKFKTIPSRMYDASGKRWSFALEDHGKLVEALKPLRDSVIVSPLPRTVVNIFSKASEKLQIPEKDLSNLDPVLQDALLPFQREGVSFGIHHNCRVLIADDMGLGKTIQAIGIANHYKEHWPLLVVTPSSVRYAWADAFRTWMPSLDPQEITFISSGKDFIPKNKVILMSYDILTKKCDDIVKRNFKIAIMDESHFLKNHKSARTKAALLVIKHMKYIIMLSGTPALSRPMELFTQLSALKPEYYSNYVEFGVRYCNGKKMPWGWDFNGSSNMGELQLLLEETVMIRRLKSEVIKQLPPKRRQMIILDPALVLSKSKILNVMSLKMCRDNLKGMERRGVLLEYFHETGVVKLPAICQYIKDLVEAERKFICFAHHQEVMNGICSAIEKANVNYVRIDGSTTAERRKEVCDRFQVNESCKVAVLSITAANAGITLTSAQLVVFAELFWNPGILTQAEDRAHRIGQEDSVIVQYLVAKSTADDYIWPLVQKKLNILNKAGLSKDNFTDADTVHTKSSAQPLLSDFWEEMAFDDEFSVESEQFPDADTAHTKSSAQPLLSDFWKEMAFDDEFSVESEQFLDLEHVEPEVSTKRLKSCM